MISPKMKEFLEAGVHFGHQTRRWNPKMKPFIFAARNGIYIIDLQKTINALNQAKRKIAEVIGAGRPVLFVGTKKQAKEVILEQAPRCGGFHVTERWLGGMLTNFNTIRNSIKKLKEIERMRDDGTINNFTKKERSRFDHEEAKLNKVLAGIKEMNGLPGLAVIIDTRKEKIAVAEANKLGIPIIGILDTNADPDPIDFPIAANDDAIKSIRVLMRDLVDAAVESQSGIGIEILEGSDNGDSEPKAEQSGDEASASNAGSENATADTNQEG